MKTRPTKRRHRQPHEYRPLARLFNKIETILHKQQQQQRTFHVAIGKLFL